MEAFGRITRHGATLGSARDKHQTRDRRHCNFRALYYERTRAVPIARQAKPCGGGCTRGRLCAEPRFRSEVPGDCSRTTLTASSFRDGKLRHVVFKKIDNPLAAGIVSVIFKN